MRPRVLILGGAGVFGARLAEGLAASTDAQLIIAGRSFVRAEAVARTCRAEVAVLDRDSATPEQIAALKPCVVVDAAGPYQGADYRFAIAALEAGAHYLDLADARDFVAGFDALDDLAKRQGKAAITGASSTPGLTHAALDALCAGWRRVDAIRAGIAPGNRAPKGESLVRAILSRAGALTSVFEAGAWRKRPGWSHQRTIDIGGLGKRRFALVETPDLDLIPRRFAPRDEAVFMAALELGVLHRGLEAIGALRRWGVWRNPERAAGLFARCAKLVEGFGCDRGAMIVEALGRDAADKACVARWTLFAEAGLGPYAPTLPALAVVRRMLAGDVAPGARACAGFLTLDDIAADCARIGLTTKLERRTLESPFARALGDAFAATPAPVVAAHASGPVTRLNGAARVAPAASPLGAIAGACVGFPRAAERAPVEVTMRLEPDGRETWTRTIGGRRFKSVLSYAAPDIVRERFGPFSFDMAVAADAEALSMQVTGWRFGPLALPRALAPRSLARETAGAGGLFRFDVPVALPWLGRLTHYQGELEIESHSRPAQESAA